MASGPITLWQVDGETMETVTDFIFGGFKITADGDCGREIKRCLLFGRKAMSSSASIFETRDIIPTTVPIVRLWFFQWSCIHVRVAPERRLSAKEFMLLNCGVGEDS